MCAYHTIGAHNACLYRAEALAVLDARTAQLPCFARRALLTSPPHITQKHSVSHPKLLWSKWAAARPPHTSRCRAKPVQRRVSACRICRPRGARRTTARSVVSVHELVAAASLRQLCAAARCYEGATKARLEFQSRLSPTI